MGYLVSKMGKMAVNASAICIYSTDEDDDKETYAIIFDLYDGKQTQWIYTNKKKYLKDVKHVAKELRNWQR